MSIYLCGVKISINCINDKNSCNNCLNIIDNICFIFLNIFTSIEAVLCQKITWHTDTNKLIIDLQKYGITYTIKEHDLTIFVNNQGCQQQFGVILLSNINKIVFEQLIKKDISERQIDQIISWSNCVDRFKKHSQKHGIKCFLFTRKKDFKIFYKTLNIHDNNIYYNIFLQNAITISHVWRENIDVNRLCLQLSKSHIEYIWIDKYCINQSDIYEKSIEINKMHIYYSKSLATLVVSPSLDKLFSYFIESIEIILNGIQKLLKIEWWSRIWTYQETELPETLLFLIDNIILTPTQIWYYIKIIHAYFDMNEIWSIYDIADKLLDDSEHLLVPDKSPENIIARVFSNQRIRKSRFPQDMVYGILGLFPDIKMEINYFFIIDQYIIG